MTRVLLIVLFAALSACSVAPPDSALLADPSSSGVLLTERQSFAEGNVTVTVLEQLNEVSAFAVFNLTQEMKLLEREAFPDFELSSESDTRYSSIGPIEGEQDTYAVEVGTLAAGENQYCYRLKILFEIDGSSPEELAMEGCT